MDEADDHPCIQPRRERRDASANRERILATARLLFSQHGVEATSMNMVAQAARVGPGTLYRHFAYKGALCAGLLEADITAFQQRVIATIDEVGEAVSPLNQLDWLLHELMAMIETHIPLFTVMQEIAPGGRRHAMFQFPFHRWLHERIVRLLERAVERGEVASLDPAFTADAIFAAIAPPLYAFQREERGFSRERIVAGVRRLFIDGLRAGENTPQR